ncbi:hypothetical protein DFH08DRAFT_1035880 [Mycena albidolilacea]|uniref:Bromodomain associated domain-containing protein n=1 Tax=Mycena albidolilacea TaxID=1033008 RepID=A0AAD6ZEP8_9AGAR|nr:hypothetical protein DFH08DRAFT_1035880 [Mycena albidolilacea]
MNRTPFSLSRIVVEADTHRSLHAAAFSCSSTHASAILTDLLACYIQLLANTAAKYAQHAGHTKYSNNHRHPRRPRLWPPGPHQLCPEAKDLLCYAIYSGHCVEELNEFKAQLGRIQCDNKHKTTINTAPRQKPLKNASKTQYDTSRTQTRVVTNRLQNEVASGKCTRVPSSRVSPALDAPTAPLLLVPLRLSPSSSSLQPPPSPQTTSSKSPYKGSSLANVSQWHLPGPPPQPLLPATPNATTAAIPQALNPELALYKAFHHILTNPTCEPTAPFPTRHCITVGLLQHAALFPWWEFPDTMYTAYAPAPPSRLAHCPHLCCPHLPPPRCDGNRAPNTPLPPTHHTVAAPSQITPLMGSQGSCLPELAHHVLLPANTDTTGVGTDRDGDRGKGEKEEQCRV